MIHFAVVHKGQSRMDVVASDTAGHRRKVGVTWAIHNPNTDIPPDNWLQLVADEMRVMLSYEEAVAAGRMLP